MNTPIDKLNKTMGQMSEKEIEEARAAISASIAEDSRESVADLKRAGRIADDFMRGLDKMTIVLMSMVLKFGRAVTMTKISLIAQSIGIGLFIAGLLMGFSIGSKMDSISEDQAQLIKRLNATEGRVANLTEEVKGAREAMEDAIEAAPKVVTDGNTGEPKLVLQSEESKTTSTRVKVDSGRSAPVKDAPKKGKVEFDLDF